MKALGKISITLAVAILLLHTLLPHQHQGEFDPQYHYLEHKDSSFLDYLKTAFHLNQGEGHLENFQIRKAAPVQFQAVLFDIPHIIFEPSVESLDVVFPAQDYPFPAQHFPPQRNFRGPPQQS